MKRKVVQITSHVVEECGITIALADDGTVWEGYLRYHPNEEPKYKFKWEQLPDLPSDISNLSKVAK